jgi:hypothetical protein
MGSFGGHALPGSFFIVFALWWVVQTYRCYYRSLRKGAAPFRSTATFQCDCLCGRVRNLEWEGMIKVFFITVGFSLEIITAFQNGVFTHLGNGQHATMFFFFGISGVIDIIIHHQPNLLPQGIEYMIGILAFSVEGILFAFHTHGRSPMDMLIHTLLVYAISACVIVTLIELRYRNNVLVTLARAYVVLVQGTWFWQAGFILYNPNHAAQPWDQQSHEQMMVVTMMFAWHMAAAFIIILSIGLLVKLAQRCCGDELAVLSNGGYDQIKLIGNGGRKRNDHNQNRDSVVDFEDSDDDDDAIMFKRSEIVLTEQT